MHYHTFKHADGVCRFIAKYPLSIYHIVYSPKGWVVFYYSSDYPMGIDLTSGELRYKK